MKKILFNMLKFMLVVFFFWYILVDIDLNKLINVASNYSYFGIFLTVMIIILSDIIYSYRWVYISNNKCRFIPAFESTILSTILNLILPAKLGEVSRIIYLKKMYNFKIHNSISLLIIEKFFELGLLAIVSILATMLIINNDYVSYIGYGLLCAGIVFLILLKSRFLFLMIQYIPMKFLRVYTGKIFKFINKSFTYSKLFNIFPITVLIWFTYYLTEYVFFIYVANFDLSIYEVFVVFVISIIAFSVPLTPGAVGVYESSIIMALGWYGIDKENALMAAISLRFLHLFLMALFSLFILFKKDISFLKFKKVLS